MGNENSTNKQIIVKDHQQEEEFSISKQHKPPLKFPSHIFKGDDLLIAIGSKSCGKYERFSGGEFWYIYESVKRINGEKCRFEIQSNMPLNKIEPPAVNVHSIQLNIYVMNEKEEKELLLKAAGDNYIFRSQPDIANREKIAKINAVVGIDLLSYSDRASWDIMMNYMEIYDYFRYYTVVPGSSNETIFREILTHDSTIIDNSENSVYKTKFHKKEVDGLEAQYSWNYVDISKYPYIEMLKYDGEELKYSELLDTQRNVGVITIIFNSQIIYKATYPYEKIEKQGYVYIPNIQHPIYKTGLICEIDERTPDHCVLKFVDKMLQITLKQNRKFEMEEIEKEWVSFCSNQFQNLVMILNFGNYKYLHCLSLRRALQNPATYSDIVFSFN